MEGSFQESHGVQPENPNDTIKQITEHPTQSNNGTVVLETQNQSMNSTSTSTQSSAPFSSHTIVSQQTRVDPNLRGHTSRYRGVSWNAKKSKWRADIRIHGQQRYLGLFPTENEAAGKKEKEKNEKRKLFCENVTLSPLFSPVLHPLQ